MEKLMLTNQAIAQGAWEAGAKVLSAYPGTPSTEIAESASKYAELYCEWAPNEKVALEVAYGACVAGVRAMACMKHVGLNVAADPLFTASYTGVGAGLCIVVADDPGMHSSQNEQDSRFYARSAHVPMLEPSDSNEAKEFTKLAYKLSESYDTPILLRTTTRIAHSQSVVKCQPREDIVDKVYIKDMHKYTMMPSNAKLRHVVVEEREKKLKSDLATLGVNKVEYIDTKLGIVCSGAVYQYVKEVCPTASVFKVGMVYPLDVESIRGFAKKVDRLLVVEELEPFFENQLKANGISCEGKNIFSLQGEITPEVIKSSLYGEVVKKPESAPVRPPVLCAGCPHRGVFYVLNRLKCVVTGDIGCYTLGANAPLSAVDTVLCMGASVGMSHGFCLANADYSKKTVAVIGDSTFLHSGVTGLINSVYNKGTNTVMILDNSTTGMTGHQEHPATGKTLKGEPTYSINLEELCRACGVKRVTVVDSYDIVELEKVIKEELSCNEVSVIIARKPCELLKKGQKPTAYVENCKGCKMCMKLGCPALVMGEDGKVSIDSTLCVGCMLCAKVCKFNSIKLSE